MSWSVRWTLAESAIPAEIDRRKTIFPEDPIELLEREARYEQSRSYDTKPRAEFAIKCLKERRIAAEIKLIRFSPKGEILKYQTWAMMNDEPDRFAASGFAFASGLSRSNRDMDAAIAARQPIGVSVHEAITEPMRRRIVDYANSGGLIFIDSGAFTTFTKGRETDWATVMGRYKEIFYRVNQEHRSNLHFVAPDVVGNAEATAELVRETYGMFQFVMEDGGNIIAPIHKEPDGTYDIGAVDNWFPRHEFPDRFIIGIPFNKVAWSQDDVLHLLRMEVRRNEEYQRTFGRSIPKQEQLRIHLLGGGPSKVNQLIEKIQHMGLTCGSITGDAFHGPARNRKFQNLSRQKTQTVTPQRASMNHQPHTTMRYATNSAEESVSLSNPTPAFTFRAYQKEDLPRAAMHDGAIIAWDPGLGKTMAIFALPMLKRASYALIVAPGGLHEQIIDEGRTKFGVDVTPIPDQATAYRLMREGKLPLAGSASGVSSTDPRYFITSYTALGYNGADEWNPGEPNELLRARRLTILARNRDFPDSRLAYAMATADWKTKDKVDKWTVLSLPRNASEERIRTALRTAAMLFHPNVQPDDGEVYWRWHRIFTTGAELLGLSDHATSILADELATDPAVISAASALAEIEKGIGHEKDLGEDGQSHTIKCVFTPTLASIVCGAFDFTVCDEAVRLKSGTSYQAQGILRMASRYRYALTGTPIKNKLPDIFFLASWVTGHTSAAIARWPYGNGVEDRGQFSRDFGVVEENLTKQEAAAINGKKAPPPKTTNHICNVHRLWRILGPVVIRRRKDQVKDATIVTKTIVPIRVMPGKQQHATYRYHLSHAPEKRSILASIGAQLQNLRQAALNPSSMKLAPDRSQSAWTPKFTAILKLAADLLTKGEQVVIFSPFTDFSSSLSGRFRDAGVKHLLLDGNITPAKRGSLIKKFKSREVPVLIAGIDSMGEGHSLDNARHLVLPSLSWAFDSNTQAVERVHRLTSKNPVTIYVMVTTGTIDERLTSIWQEKGDSSDLALDGRLITTEREEIDLGQLLRDAVDDFNPKAETLDEEEVSAHWRTSLLAELTAAGKAYHAKTQPVIEVTATESTTPTPTPPPAIHNPDTRQPQTTPHRPRSLFDIMKNNNNNRPAPQPEPQPAPAPARHPATPNIIPFPGRLGTAIAAKPYAMEKVNFAALLRR